MSHVPSHGMSPTVLPRRLCVATATASTVATTRTYTVFRRPLPLVTRNAILAERRSQDPCNVNNMIPLGFILLLQTVGEAVAPSILCLALLGAPAAASRRLQACAQADPGLFGVAHQSSHGFAGRIVSDRNGNVHRDRDWWEGQVSSFSEKHFRCFYKVTRDRFDWLADLIQKDVEPSDLGKLMAIRSSGSYVNSRAMLAMTMRFLAGGSVHDICLVHGVADSTFYECIWRAAVSFI